MQFSGSESNLQSASEKFGTEKKQRPEQGVLTATGGFRVGEEVSQVMYSQETMWRNPRKS